MRLSESIRPLVTCGGLLCLFLPGPGEACTGVTLTSGDGSVVYGRTLEWGAFDLKSRLSIVPRGVEFVGVTPDGRPGYQWTGRYGVVGIDALEKNIIADGVNEKGLTVGLFYHPGFASYQEYFPANASRSMSPTDVPGYLLTSFATVDEVREGMAKVSVVPVIEEALGFPAPIHLAVTEPSGRSIVIEFIEGEQKIFDNPLGVVTNAPTFDWHLTNLRNYVNLSPVAMPGGKLAEIDFSPLGGGSGMIGLPGDFTPPSRFVRAVAFSQAARPTATGRETVYELFRILDSFNVPLGAAEGSDGASGATKGMRSSTVWTTAIDTRAMVLYYHTQHNRRVRKVDLGAIDWDERSGGIQHIPLDKEKVQDILDMTPRD